ncbi:MAG TPA: two-component regulator propeller domain-containing protein [Verrucomicrobiae bacterium]|nr:two-component regulator propeller domain-containing protein [Verrucomicrobiae bacterium]
MRPVFPKPNCRAGVFAVVLFLAILARTVVAETDFLIDQWDTENGLPSSTVTSIAQTPDGYLWVGTYNGLARFDGNRFVIFDPVTTPELTHPRIQGLFLDKQGTLWINTFRGGLTSYRDGIFRNEWPDQNTFDLHTTLAWSSSNEVVFVTQFGSVLRRTLSETNWDILTPPANSLRPMFQCADRAGNLWFLSRESHILRVNGSEFKSLPDDGGLKGHIYTLVADANGKIWAGAQNEIAFWNGSRFVNVTPTNDASKIEPTFLFPTKKGPVWVLDGDRLREFSNGKWTDEVVGWRGLLGPASGRAMGAHEDSEGGIWFNHYGNGLFHITPDGKFQRLTTSSANGLAGDRNGLASDRIWTWFQSREGGIWLGMDRGGLAHLRDRKIHVVGLAEGLPSRTVLSVCATATNEIWLGTSGGGLCKWEDGKIVRFPVGASAAANFIFSIFPQSNSNGFWLSAGEGEDLYEFHNGKISRAAWDVHGVKSILTDHAGRTWIGTKTGMAWSQGNQTGTFTLGADGSPLPAFRALTETPDGTVWAGADDGALYRCQTNGLTAFHPKDALADQPIVSLYSDRSGVIWAGTFRGGLLRFSSGVFKRITSKQGLSVDVISQILEDDSGRLWLGTHQGIYCVSKAELNACADGRAHSVNFITYGPLDAGLPTLECSDGYQPACWRDADGVLWFSTARGAIWVKPDQAMSHSPPPPVIVEELRVDGEKVNLRQKKIIIPPGHRQFDFRFTALNFDAPDKVRFRYKIDGFDSDWVDANTLRTAHYPNLPPNTYYFHVIACDNEGVWNDEGAGIAFTVEPYFYQTIWFKILVGFAIAGIIAFAVRKIATRKYKARLRLLEQQHAIERDRTRIAKDIHDDIGAGLTQITLLTELARRQPEQTSENLSRISDSARQLTRAMDEIVWAVDPQHDTFEGLLDYISAYAEDFLRVAGIPCRMDLPAILPAMHIEAEVRYNLFLALKETLNNVVKHAQATEVWLRLRLEHHGFSMIVEDNGMGLSGVSGATAAGKDRIISGAGFSNLEQRLKNIGGHCSIFDTGHGTRVVMTVKLKNATSPVVAIGRDNGDGLE